jgi:hypothetical protein
MTVPSEASFPGSRVLAGWWRELISVRPRSLWIGHFVLHRLEGLVRAFSPVTVGRLETLLLRFLQSSASIESEPRWERLSLNPVLLLRISHGLATEGLATRLGDRTWKLTPKGIQAITDGKRDRMRDERRVFSFVSTLGGESAHFIRLLSEPPAAVAAALANPRFNPALYQACFTQSAEWKKRFGFPENVSAASGLNEPESTWRGLIIDHAASIALALVGTREESADGGLLGFWTGPAEWMLQSEQPAFRLAIGWQDVFPTLESVPAPDDWRRAWRSWCQARGLPASDVERCSLSLEDCRLAVHVPRRLLERLQALRSDALKGEAWVVAGAGPVRRAASLEVIEEGADGRSAFGRTVGE